MAELTANHSDVDLITYIHSCFLEAEAARETRDDFTRANYDMFHMRHDFSHKTEGQSTEVLSKQRMAVESTKSFFQQALADISEWFSIEYKNESVDEAAMAIKPGEAKRLLDYELTRANYFSHVGLCIQRGLLGGVMITKAHGKLTPSPKFRVKAEGKGKKRKKNVVAIEDKSWNLEFSRIRNEDFFPDPTGQGLYEIEEMYVDMHTVRALSEGDDAIYDKEVVNSLATAMTEETLHEQEKRRETGDDTNYQSGHRPKVKIREFWGTVVSSEGKILHENVVITVANDKFIIRKPTANPLWHQQSPYTVTGLLEVDGSVWPIALMDAATKHNHTLIEMLNLILDAAFKKVHAPSQIRISDLANPEQIANGIKPGVALKVKSSLPPGAKVMEPLDATDVPNDALNVMNLIQQEFNSSALTTDLRSGALPSRSVLATEVVEQSQTITSVFQGISKNIEQSQIVKELELAWMTIAQNLDMISKDELISLFGIERGTEISQLDPQDVFVQTVSGYKFQVFGISQTLAKAQDYRKLTTMLQTISGSELLIEEFLNKYDMGKFLGEIMSSLNINKDKIKIDEQQGGGMLRGQEASMEPTQDMASVPDASQPGSAFMEAFGQEAPGSGGPQ